MSPITGAGMRATFLHEDNGFKSSPSDSTHKTFGYNQRVTTAEASNNGQRITLPASHTTVSIQPGTFAGSWAAEFGLATPWWANAIWGPPSTTDNSDDSYTHTYSWGEPQPQRIFLGYDTSSAAERVLEGCVAARMGISPTTDDGSPSTVTLEGFYCQENVSTGADLQSQPDPDPDPLAYKDASLTLGGDDVGIVQSASLDVPVDTRPIPGFGTRFALDFVSGHYQPTLDFSEITQDSDNLQDVYGGSTSVQEDVDDTDAIALTFSNGQEAGSGINEGVFNCTGGFPDTYDDSPMGDPSEIVEEQRGDLIQDVELEWTNETESAK